MPERRPLLKPIVANLTLWVESEAHDLHLSAAFIRYVPEAFKEFLGRHDVLLRSTIMRLGMAYSAPRPEG